MAKYYDGYDWDTDGFPGEFVYGGLGCGDEYYMDERWKRLWDTPDYWLSNKGRVWSSIKEKFLDGSPLAKGYIDFTLQQDGHRVHRSLHRLLGREFIPNPNNYPNVCHLDDDGSNNDLGNLEWGTQLHNVHDCIRNGHFRYFTKEDVERANEVRRTPIVAIRLRDNRATHFISQQEAGRQLGIEQSCINGVLRGKSKSAGGYYFVYRDQYDPERDYSSNSYQRRGIPVKATNIETGETRIYNKPRQAAFDLNINEASISNVLRGKARSAKGWIFEVLDKELADD